MGRFWVRSPYYGFSTSATTSIHQATRLAMKPGQLPTRQVTWHRRIRRSGRPSGFPLPETNSSPGKGDPIGNHLKWRYWTLQGYVGDEVINHLISSKASLWRSQKFFTMIMSSLSTVCKASYQMDVPLKFMRAQWAGVCMFCCRCGSVVRIICPDVPVMLWWNTRCWLSTHDHIHQHCPGVGGLIVQGVVVGRRGLVEICHRLLWVVMLRWDLKAGALTASRNALASTGVSRSCWGVFQ